MVDNPVERPIIGAYWGQRSESARECAERLRQCVERLGEADPMFGAWFGGGSTRAEAWADPLASEDIGSLTRRFEEGALRRDDTGEAMPSGGFVVSWWNGQDAAAARLRAGVGIASDFQVNSVVLELPSLAQADRLYQPEVAVRILGAIQSAWEPEWATWITDTWRSAQPLMRSWPPSVGWLTYLGDVQPHPLEVGSMVDWSGGVLVRAADTYPLVTVDTLLAVRAGLERAGDLRPVHR